MDDKNITIKKYKKQLKIFRSISIVLIFAVFIYLLITVLKSETFDTNVIIACSVFACTTVVFCLLFIFFDIKRKHIILKYFGTICQADRNKAKALLKKVNILDKNEYNLFDTLRYDIDDLIIPQILKKLSKGEKIYIDLYKPIKTIEQEIKSNKEKYIDEDFNHFIFELVLLLENNLCEI